MFAFISNWCDKRNIKNSEPKFKNRFITCRTTGPLHSYLTWEAASWSESGERNKHSPSKRRPFWHDISGSTSSAGRLLHLQRHRLWSYWPNIDSAYTELLNRKAQSTFSINPMYIHKHTKAYTCEGWFQVRDGRYNKVQDDESCLLLPSVLHLHVPLSLSPFYNMMMLLSPCSWSSTASTQKCCTRPELAPKYSCAS